MKAVILAGGLGTRLRPITYRTPKPLVPLVGKPIVMHIIDSLPSSVDTVVLAVSYMKDELEEYFRVNDCGRKVILVNETTPLGTGGAIKNVEEHLDGTFIVINGDVLTSIDFNSMVDHHRQKGGIGTISLWQVEDPTAFGVVGLDQHGRINALPGEAVPGRGRFQHDQRRRLRFRAGDAGSHRQRCRSRSRGRSSPRCSARAFSVSSTKAIGWTAAPGRAT